MRSHWIFALSIGLMRFHRILTGSLIVIRAFWGFMRFYVFADFRRLGGRDGVKTMGNCEISRSAVWMRKMEATNINKNLSNFSCGARTVEDLFSDKCASTFRIHTADRDISPFPIVLMPSRPQNTHKACEKLRTPPKNA